MKRILHVTTVPETLGFLKGQIGFMKDSGFEMIAITDHGDCYTAPEVEKQFDQIIRVRMRRAITPLRDLKAALTIWSLMKKMRPSIVAAHTPKGGLLGMIAARMAGIPIRLYHMHGLPHSTLKGWRRRLLRTTEIVSCRCATKVLCVSRSLQKQAFEEGLVKESKCGVLLNGSINGVDTEYFSRAAALSNAGAPSFRDAYGIRPNDLVVGFVGRIVRDKGIDDIVEAWPLILAEIPNAKLLVVGDFETRDSVSPESKTYLKHEQSVRLVGRQMDMPSVYKLMDLVLLPTYREGLNTVLLEAGSMDLPVVSTRVTGCIDVVEEGVSGTLVEPGAPGAIARAVITYLQDADLRKRHGEAARALVKLRFDRKLLWTATREEYENQLRCVVPDGEFVHL